MESGSVIKGLAYGGFASCVAEVVTMPIDVVKTRMQFSGAHSVQYKGSLDAASQILRKEGAQALFKGLKPALLRQATYGAMRYGLYAPIRNSLGVDPSLPKSEIPIVKKIIAGASAGAVASFLANPTEAEAKPKAEVEVGKLEAHKAFSDDAPVVTPVFNKFKTRRERRAEAEAKKTKEEGQ